MSRPGAIALGLAAAAGFLVGVLVVVGLGGASGEDARTVTVVRTTPPADHTVVTRTAVPDVSGERLDVARERIERSGFLVDVDGGGLLGVVVEENWEVVAQEPPAGTMRERSSSVTLEVERR